MLRSSLLSRSCALLLGISLLGAGCARSSEPSSPSGAGSETRPVTGGSVSLGLSPRSACDHPYYPLRDGYRVRYQIQSRDVAGASQTHHYSQRVQSAMGNSVSLTTSFEDLGESRTDRITSTQTINCADGSLRADTYVDFGSRLSGRASQFKVNTRRVTGQMLPPDLRVGSEWEGSFDISMVPTGAGESPIGTGIDMTVRMRRKVVAEETVTVPAGTYRALKVTATTDFGGEGGAPLVTTEWWAEGAGLVKSVFAGGGTMGDIVTVAQEVVVP